MRSTLTAGGAAAREPYVAPGGVLTVSVRGFAPRAVLTERIDASRTIRRLRADEHGRATVRVRVPRALGRHRVIFVGRGAGVPRGPSRPPRAGTGDVQPIRVEVPRVDVVPFRVTRRATRGVILGESVTPGGHAGPGTGPDAAGRPAATGFDGPSQVLFGALLVLAGGALTLAGRRNRGESATPAAQPAPLA